MRPLHCYTNESCFSFLFIFANSLLILSIPFIHQCVFDVYCARQRTYIHVFGDSLCKVNICHRIARCSLRVHRLPTVDFIFILFCVCVCVYHSACWWLQPKPEMTVVTGKSLLFSYWQSSRTAPVNMIGGMTDLLATAVQYCMYARGQWVLCLLLVLFECRAGADSKLTQLLRSIILSLQFDCTSICVFHVFFFFLNHVL